MNYISETEIEAYAIQLLESLGYAYLYAPDIAPDGENPKRSSFAEVLIPEILQQSIHRINPQIPHSAQQQAYQIIQRMHSPELITNMLVSSTF